MRTIKFRGIEINICNNEEHFTEVEKGIWETETFDVLDRFLKPDKVFLDIGAWVGTLSLYAVKKGAYAKAYEPDPVASKWLIENIDANKGKKGKSLVVVMGRQAVSNDYGEMKLYGCYGNSMSSPTRQGEQFEIVQTVPFSETISKDICLIKIDTEGGEVNIMTPEALEALKQANLPPILLSVHPSWIDNFELWWLGITSHYLEFYDINPVAQDCYLFTAKN